MRIYLNRAAAIVVGKYGGQGKRLQGTRITFDLSKSLSSSLNNAKVSVFNLAPDTRALLETRGTAITLQAGYGEAIDTLFAGEVLKATTRYDPPNWVSEVDCVDGLNALRSAVLYQTFPEGMPRRAVISALVNRLVSKGVSRGVIEETSVLFAPLSSPLTVSGSIRNILDRLAFEWGFTWSIQDGVFEIRDVGKLRPGWRLVPLISPKSGLIGSPERTEEGLHIRCLLTPAIYPGQRFKLESSIKGIFQAIKVNHRGDTHGGDWTTDIICKEAQ